MEMASNCNICKLNKCKIKGKSFSSQHKYPTDALNQALWNQHKQGRFCDAFLKSGENFLPAHKCVLVLESGYFNGLFAGNFSDDNLTHYVLPEAPVDCIEKVLEYLYTGMIELKICDIEDVYILADYLCVEKLRNFCHDVMIDMIDCQTCFTILEIGTKFDLKNIKDCVIEFMCPFAKQLLQDYKSCLQLSPSAVEFLFHNNKINYVSEKFLCDFLLQWAKIGSNKDYAKSLFEGINPAYISKDDCASILQNPDSVSFMDDNIKEEYQRRLTTEDDNIIICRTRGESPLSENIQLLSYSINNDDWKEIQFPGSMDFRGLESMIQHKDMVYFLTSTTEDLCGYMYSANEIKTFFSFSLGKKQLHQLPSPNKVGKQCVLVSHLNGLFVLDKCGVIEMFDEISHEWFDVGANIFSTVPLSTLYYMPMPMDRYIYVLRVYSLGYSPEFAEFAISLHLYDTISGTSRVLSNIESSEIELQPTERFHGYVVVPGKIFLKDSLGQNRVEYDITSGTWQCLEVQNQVPESLGTVWGTVQSRGRCYIVCNYSPQKQHFLMYDWSKKRLKELSLPDQPLTGLMLYLPQTLQK